MTRGTRLAEANMMAPRLAAGGFSRWTVVLADYWTLTKPEVNFLILITTFAGFYLASPASHWRILLLFNTIVGTMLVARDRKSTRLNSSHSQISYAVFCLKKKK